MTEQSITLLACLAVITLLVVLLYRANRGRPDPSSQLRYLGGLVAQTLSHAQNVDLALNRHRAVLNDAHRRICAVTKGIEKRPS